jgi:hypothetical protein
MPMEFWLVGVEFYPQTQTRNEQRENKAISMTRSAMM